jgi:CHAD domain-containing protein
VHVEPALAGKVEPLHQARVATRRLRELAPLLAVELGDKATKKIMVRLRDL